MVCDASMVASHGMVTVCVAHGDASSVYSQLMIKIVEVACTMYHIVALIQFKLHC